MKTKELQKANEVYEEIKNLKKGIKKIKLEISRMESRLGGSNSIAIKYYTGEVISEFGYERFYNFAKQELFHKKEDLRALEKEFSEL